MSENISAKLRVASIRSRKLKGIIFSGYPITELGLQDNSRPYVVRAVGNDYSNIQQGELWHAKGKLTKQTITINGLPIVEPLIIAESLYLLRPSGNQIIRWIVENNEIKGIKNVKAQKLWSVLGEGLYHALDNGDIEPIIKVINNQKIANNLIDVWAKDGDSKTLKWMQEKRIPLWLSRKVIKFHGKNTLSALQEDPYRLLSFCASWNFVDKIATQIIGFEKDDKRRLQGAVEQVLYNQIARGHTCVDRRSLKSSLSRLLKSTALANTAIHYAKINNSVQIEGESFHSIGTWIMEHTVAHYIAHIVRAPIQLPLMTESIDQLIDRFEIEEAAHLGIRRFKLTSAQRSAVKCSFQNRFSIITGGPGVGKTTILKALYKLIDTLGYPIFQMALSGRAAKRMSEATCEQAYTIDGFLCNVKQHELGDYPIIVIDEASMVDLASMYRLIRRLPKTCNMVMVGDPHQLPPVSAGLVFHCLMDVAEIPVSELAEVKRQAEDSKIPHFAMAIRKGIWPKKMLNSYEGHQIQIVPCSNNEVIKRVLTLYDHDRSNTQILSATNANVFSGCKVINNSCRYRYTQGKGARALKLYGEETGLYEGDLLLFTKNDWSRDLQNGSLGKLVEAFDKNRPVVIGEDQNQREVDAIGLADWEGRTLPILEHDIEALQHGYAITVHKAQGSQFNRVIIPFTKSRIDRALIYTAITRAVDQIIIVGDIAAAEKAVLAPPSAIIRSVALPGLLEQALGIAA